MLWKYAQKFACAPLILRFSKGSSLFTPTYVLTLRAENVGGIIPGAVVLITRDDREVKKSAYGLADIELGVKTTPDMVFESGSIGKTFTATVIMQLYEQGKTYRERTP